MCSHQMCSCKMSFEMTVSHLSMKMHHVDPQPVSLPSICWLCSLDSMEIFRAAVQSATDCMHLPDQTVLQSADVCLRVHSAHSACPTCQHLWFQSRKLLNALGISPTETTTITPHSTQWQASREAEGGGVRREEGVWTKDMKEKEGRCAGGRGGAENKTCARRTLQRIYCFFSAKPESTEMRRTLEWHAKHSERTRQVCCCPIRRQIEGGSHRGIKMNDCADVRVNLLTADVKWSQRNMR